MEQVLNGKGIRQLSLSIRSTTEISNSKEIRDNKAGSFKSRKCVQKLREEHIRIIWFLNLYIVEFFVSFLFETLEINWNVRCQTLDTYSFAIRRSMCGHVRELLPVTT